MLRLDPYDTPSFTHYDGRGDVTAKTDGTGAVTYQASYRAFGTRSVEGGDTQDRQKANTKEEDPSGLLCEGMRYRDLNTGTFTTADPAGFVDGPNLYAYVRQNPWTHFDPEGLTVDFKRDDSKQQQKEYEQYKAGVMKGSDDLAKETLNTMEASKRRFTFAKAKDVSVCVSARENVVKNFLQLRAHFAGKNAFNPEFFDKDGNLLSGKNFADALRNMFGAGAYDKTALGCNAACLVSIEKARIDTDGDDSVKGITNITDGRAYNNTSLKSVTDANDWIPGDWGGIGNASRYRMVNGQLMPTQSQQDPVGAYVGENIIYMGKGKWGGFGFGTEVITQTLGDWQKAVNGFKTNTTHSSFIVPTRRYPTSGQSFP